MIGIVGEMFMALKSGSKVILKNKFLRTFNPQPNYEGLMDKWQGKKVTIDSINSDGNFKILEDNEWWFSKDYIKDFELELELELDIE